MSNKGLKSYTTNLEFGVGDISCNVNLFKADANLVLGIPIFSTTGFSPINLELIYNKQNDGTVGLFGKGVNLSYFNKIIDNGSTISINNSDGSVDQYIESGNYYINRETGLYIEKTESYNDEDGSSELMYDIRDLQGNIISYNDLYSINYPHTISRKNGEHTYISEYSSYYTISNNDVNSVYLNKTSGKITSIEWKQNSSVILTANLTYTNDYLTGITVVKSGVNIKSYTISYTTTLITVLDNMSGRKLEFTLSGNMVTKVVEKMDGKANTVSTNITYSTYRTVVTDEQSHQNTYVFDVDGIIRFIKDENDNINSYHFDMIFKKKASEAFISKNLEKVNLLEGKTVSSFTKLNSNYTSYTETDTFYKNYVDSTVYRITAANTFSYTISGDFLTSDVFTFIAWIKNGVTGKGLIVIEDEYGNLCRTDLNKTSADGQYEPIVVGLALKKGCKNITVKIQGLAGTFDVGKVELLRQKFGSFYAYNDDGNVANVNNNGNVTNYMYTGSLVTNRLSGNTKGVINKFDSKNRVTESLGAYQVKQTNTYDTKNRVLTNEIKDQNGTEILNRVNSYPSDLETNNSDELSNTTNTEKDVFDNVLKVTNALGQIVEYTRNGKMLIETIKLYLSTSSTEILKTTITYDSDHHNNIKTITLKNGSVYSFGYDDYDRISTIHLNNVLLITYSYDKFDNILTIRYGENGDLVTFTYLKGNIDLINFDGVTYTYTYNKLNQITTIKKGSTVIKTLSYDNNGRIKRILDKDSNELEYHYDNLDNINRRKRNVDGLTLYEAFDMLYRSYGSSDIHLKAILDRETNYYSGLMMDGDKSIKCGSSIINANSVNTSTPTVSLNVPCVSVSSSNKLVYTISDGYADRGTFGFYAKLSYVSNGLELCRIEQGGKSIKLKLNSSYKICLEVISNDGATSQVLTTNNIISASKWNFISVSYYYNGSTTKFSVIVNDDVYNGSITKALSMATKTFYVGYAMSGYVTGVIATTAKVLDNSEVLRYHRLSQDYLFRKETVLNSLDFSNSTLYPNLDGYKLYPLNQDVKEITGDETYGPVSFEVREVVDTDSDRNFNFNTDIGRYAYVADGAKLNYSLVDGGSFTIGMRIYLDSDNHDDKRRYIFEAWTVNGNTIGLYVNSSRLLYLDYDGTSYSTGYTIAEKTWTFIGFSVNESIASGSLDELTHLIRVMVNLNEFEKTLSSSFELTNGYFSIGRKYLSSTLTTNFGSVPNVCPLMGQIEMLAIKPTSSTTSTLTSLCNNLNLTTIMTGFDEFSRYRSVSIKKGYTNILSKEVTYKKRTNSSKYTSRIPASETIRFGSSTSSNLRQYTSDDLGRLLSITDSTFGNHSYTFDNRGFLSNADGETVTYNDNGNILTKGSKDFIYDSTIKDRLIMFNGKTIGYNDTNPLNPTSYDNKTFNWAGRRLKSINIAYDDEDNDISFEFDSEGNRIKKTIYYSYDDERESYEDVYKYYYDGDLLITEITPQYRNDFLYDENRELYGLIYRNNNNLSTQYVYYYVRDIYKNIIGLVDSNGTLVVKYNCDVWGYQKSMTDTSSINIGQKNPFRYKGYYYDKETQLYWVSSRYYSPELCRWISPDSIEHLDPESINGLNLYAYCGNDPINKYDPTGHWGVWALVAITAASMIIGGTAQFVSNAMAGKTGSELWRGVAGAAVGAGVNALALCLAMPTGGASLFIAAGASAIAQTGVDTLETVIRGEEVDVGQTFIDLGLNFVTTLAGNYLGGKMIPTNSGWIQPQKFLSVFTKSYGQKILLQTAIGAGLSGTFNFVRKCEWNKIKPIVPMLVMPRYQYF